MNLTLQAFARAQIKAGLASCTPEEQLLFKRMYGHTDLTQAIDMVVDAMPVEKLDWAMQQVERTLIKRAAAGGTPFSGFPVSRSLFLDDTRDPPKADAGTIDAVIHGPWTIVRSYAEAVSWIKTHGIPARISFDHDLGAGPTGLDLARWMIEQHLDGTHLFPAAFSFVVHSQNPVGAANITALLTSFQSRVLSR